MEGLAILHTAETGSTNSDLLEQVRRAAASRAPTFAPRLLVAARQTAGRGRRGRAWQAGPGASLTMSLAWPMVRTDLAGLSLAVGVALADALEPPSAAPPRIGLKWPNDLWLMMGPAGAADRPGRKLGGILIETAACGPRRVAVIGIGINVREQAVEAAASGVAWLAEIEPLATVQSVLDRAVPPLVAALERFEEAGFAAFAARFAVRDLLFGQRLRADANGGVEGVAAGVGSRGELLLHTEGGLRAIESGEASVRLLAAEAADHRSARPETAKPAC